MWEDIKEMLSHKKWKAVIAGCLMLLVGGITKAQSWDLIAKEAVGLIVAAIVAQGAADIGKEKAKVENSNGGK